MCMCVRNSLGVVAGATQVCQQDKLMLQTKLVHLLTLQQPQRLIRHLQFMCIVGGERAQCVAVRSLVSILVKSCVETYRDNMWLHTDAASHDMQPCRMHLISVASIRKESTKNGVVYVYTRYRAEQRRGVQKRHRPTFSILHGDEGIQLRVIGSKELHIRGQAWQGRAQQTLELESIHQHFWAVDLLGDEFHAIVVPVAVLLQSLALQQIC